MTGAGATAPRVVVAGGHSAGHIEPAMNITALGTDRGLDSTLIPARGYPLELIPPVPLPRKLNRALLQTTADLDDLAAGGRAAGGLDPSFANGVLVERPDQSASGGTHAA